MRTVVGLFDSPKGARRTLDELVALGFPENTISVITNTTARSSFEGPAFHLNTMNLSDVGRVAATGPIREALTQPDGSRGLTGALTQYGLSADLAAHYSSGVQRGETLESLLVEDRDADRVMEIMRKYAVTEIPAPRPLEAVPPKPPSP
jgi:hypothetical protein